MGNSKTNEKKLGIKDCVLIASLVISILNIVLLLIFNKKYNKFLYFFALSGGLLFNSSSLYIFIDFINKNYCRRIKGLIAFFINLFFIMTPTMFVFYYPENKLYFIATSIIVYILLMIIMCFSTRIENENDVSLLKAVNLFIAFSFIAIKYLNEEINFLNEEKNFLIGYYYSLPLLGLQGLYDLFVWKKGKKITQQATTSDTAS